MADRIWPSALGLGIGGTCFDTSDRGGAPRSEMRAPRMIGGGSIGVVSRAESQIANGKDSFARFRSATSAKIFNFQEGDFYTEKMRMHPAVIKTRGEIADHLFRGCQLTCNPVASGKVHYSIGDKSLFGRGWQLIKDAVGFGTNGSIGSDPDFAVVGSFSTRSNWKTSGVDCERGFASVDFSLSNNMGSESGSRFSYNTERSNNSILGNDINGATGKYGTLYQNWDWNEEVTFEPNPLCKETQ